MTFAYFILLHTHPAQARVLFDVLDDARDLFYIHADPAGPPDLHAAVADFAKGRPHVHQLQPRRIVRGGWSLVQVHLDALRLALDAGHDWAYFINLSGQDLPLTTRTERVAALAADPSPNYIDVRPLERLRHAAWRTCIRWIEVGKHHIPTPIPLPSPNDFEHAWKGSMWVQLARPFCDWLLGEGSSRTGAFADFYRMAAIPEEFFFQTAVMNSPFRDTVAEHRRKTFWRPGAWHPETITMQHACTLFASDALFARKFDIRIDSAVVDQVRRRL